VKSYDKSRGKVCTEEREIVSVVKERERGDMQVH